MRPAWTEGGLTKTRPGSARPVPSESSTSPAAVEAMRPAGPAGRLDDAEVRLMRNEQVHVGRGEPVAAQNALGAIDEQADGDLEHFVAPHLGVVHPRLDGLLGRGMARSTARHVEQLPVLAVRVE